MSCSSVLICFDGRRGGCRCWRLVPRKKKRSPAGTQTPRHVPVSNTQQGGGVP